MLFLTNNTERMRLDSSGNLGLGVTPSAWVAGFKVLQLGSTSSLYNLSASTVLNENSYNDGTNRYLTSNFATRYVQDSGTHKFFTAPSGTAGNAITFSERMTITNAGNVGIGTSSPSTILNVKSSSPEIRIQDNKDGSWTAGEVIGQVSFYHSDSSGGGSYTTGFIKNQNNRPGSNTLPEGDLIFGTAGGFTEAVERMRLNASGNLGLGVTPSAWSGLYKAQQINARAVLAGDSVQTVLANNWFTNSSGSSAYIASAAATAFSQDAGVFKWLNAPSGTAGNTISFTQAMTLDASGNLLVGTTGASGNLLIVNGSTRSMLQGSRTNAAFQVDNTNGAPTWLQTNLIGHYYTGSQDAVSLRVPSSSTANTGSYDIFQNGTHVWYAAGGSTTTGSTATERMRIDSAGNVLVGATTGYGLLNPRFEVTKATTDSAQQGFAALNLFGGTTALRRPFLQLNRSRGTTAGTFTAVSSGDTLGALAFGGADGTSFVSST
jgi:hypothetical protein